MPQTKSWAGPGQIPLFSNFLHLFLGNFFVLRSQVWGKILAGTRHDFVSSFQKSRQNGLALGIRRSVVEWFASNAIRYGQLTSKKF